MAKGKGGERRALRADPKLLLDVIKRQAGTLSKAILEGIMNAADAKATKVEITLTRKEVHIVDDGQGFADREAITTCFEVFGHPHTEEEGKVYGTFRMGRGQLFAYGVNTWRTGHFVMEVDIKGKGLEYVLNEVPKHQPGCSIRLALYDPLLPSERMDTERDISLWAKYAPLQVFFNGKLVSTDVKEETWTHETQEAYIRLRKGATLSVYNLGIHVKDIPGHVYGTGGVVVSKQQLTVNFARNDIQSNCPVWRRIHPLLNKAGLAQMRERGSLDDDGRQRLVDRILRGEATWTEIGKANVVTLVNGRHITLPRLCASKHFTVAPRGDRLGGAIHDAGTTVVLSEETLARFHVDSGEAFHALLKKKASSILGHRHSAPPAFTAYATLAANYDAKFLILPEKSLTPLERVWVDLLNREAHSFTWCRAGEQEHQSQRRIVIGKSDAADGWTDGSTYVAINRAWLADQELDITGIVNVTLLLLHEFSHEGSTQQGCDHEMTFYENYHANVQGRLTQVVTQLLGKVEQVLATHKRRLNKRQAQTQDRIEGMRARVEKFPKDAA